MTFAMHTLVCGATRSGKSEAELTRLVPMAQRNNCAIVLLDPPGTLAQKFLLHLDLLGLSNRVLYDRLADTDRVPGYDWLVPSRNPDPLQREAEDDERIREFAAVLLRRRGIQDTAKTPLIEEGVLAALRLYMRQRSPVPLAWLADVFTLGSLSRQQMLRNCSDAELVRKFEQYAALSPVARRTETGPAERILQAVCKSPAFRARSGGATFDFHRFLDGRGILILDGGSRGNLSRDAASVMMGAVILRVIQHCRTGAQSRIVIVLDEAVNAGLIGLHESQALAEAGKWGLECHILVQDPFAFPSEEIRTNVLQNCWRHEWFRQGSPEAAKLGAEDIATPLLDPLRVHHTEYRMRTVIDSYDRIQTTSHTERTDPLGWTTARSRSWNTVLWPRRREVKDAQDRYMALTDQILLLQKELMRLRTGERFVRADEVTLTPERVVKLPDPWSAFERDDALSPTLSTARLAETKQRQILAAMKERPAYQPPAKREPPARTTASQRGAARRLAEDRAREGARAADSEPVQAPARGRS